ncbi:hypothetical protein O9929_07655 [Vibrio lentus]|nr:hypothetical protein [Vibrio lentus]
MNGSVTKSPNIARFAASKCQMTDKKWQDEENSIVATACLDTYYSNDLPRSMKEEQRVAGSRQ